MYCRSRPQYRSDLGWILGVAFLGTLTRSDRPAQGFTYVRCCSAPPASSPHGLTAPGRIVSLRPVLRAVAFGLRLLPTCSAEDLHLQSRVHAWHTKDAARRRRRWPKRAILDRGCARRHWAKAGRDEERPPGRTKKLTTKSQNDAVPAPP